MRNRYRQWMYDWETRLTTRDDGDRIVRPFEWGTEWSRHWPLANGNFPPADGADEAFLRELNAAIVGNSEQFFSYATPRDFRLRAVARETPAKQRRADDWLEFTSPVQTPFAENNLVKARWFPERHTPVSGSRRKRRALVVLPHWNSKPHSYIALCRCFAALGVGTLRLSLPYHDARMPAELDRADYAVSSNIARTIDAARQAVIDVRCCLDWLEQQGYTELGIVGTSLGSCYAFLAAAHDYRLKVCAFNHASTHFADVVWSGQATRHIRRGLEGAIDLDRLRQAWLAISPASYMERFAGAPGRKTLVIYARYDKTFLPELSQQVVEAFVKRGLDHRVAVLPCGHYTSGETPYKFLDGYHLARFVVTAF
jgi:dienelactone hydrolase